jgi:hypothetical protein
MTNPIMSRQDWRDLVEQLICLVVVYATQRFIEHLTQTDQSIWVLLLVWTLVLWIRDNEPDPMLLFIGVLMVGENIFSRHPTQPFLAVLGVTVLTGSVASYVRHKD